MHLIERLLCARIIRKPGCIWAKLFNIWMSPDEDILDALETGLALNEDSPLANLFLGLYWQRQGSHNTALDYFKVVEDLWPTNADVRVETGKSLAALGELNAALEKYQEAVELDPLDGKYYNQLAEFCVHYDYQIKEIGLPASRIAVQFNPSDESGLDIMGQVLLALDDNLNAVKFFQMALESNPAYAPAHYHLGIYYSAFDDIERAVYHLQQALIILTIQPCSIKPSVCYLIISR